MPEREKLCRGAAGAAVVARAMLVRFAGLERMNYNRLICEYQNIRAARVIFPSSGAFANGRTAACSSITLPGRKLIIS